MTSQPVIDLGRCDGTFLQRSRGDKAFDFLNHVALFGILLLMFSDQVITHSLLLNFPTYYQV